MDAWLAFLGAQSESQLVNNAQIIGQLFSILLNDPQVAAIQSSLASANDQSISAAVDALDLLDGDWPGLVALAKAYLTWCMLVDPNDPANQSFELYAKYYQALQQAFGNARGACLNIAVRRATQEMVRLFGPRGKAYLEYIGTGIFRFFNGVRSERDPPASPLPSKRSNALFYANMLSRVYFKSQQYVSASNIYNNMHSMGVVMSEFPISEQVEYRFWLGRFYLYRNDICRAFVHLDWAYNYSLPGSPQQTLILDWLMIPSLLTGRLPSAQALQQLLPEARDAMAMLSLTMRTGIPPPQYTQVLNTNMWIQARHLKPVLAMRMPLLMYRRRLQRLRNISGADRLSLGLVRSAFLLNGDSDPDFAVTEAICEQLKYDGYLLGNLLPKSKILVLKAQGCIPSLRSILETRTRKPSPRDEWMTK